MIRFLHIFVFTVIGSCVCVALAEMPKSHLGDAVRIQGPEDNWPGVYPESIVTIGGVYSNRANGVYHAEGTYNSHPIYKYEGWSIYYREAGYWALDFNDISEEWAGTVATQDQLFASTV